jgi:hypothetical protein
MSGRVFEALPWLCQGLAHAQGGGQYAVCLGISSCGCSKLHLQSLGTDEHLIEYGRARVPIAVSSALEQPPRLIAGRSTSGHEWRRHSCAMKPVTPRQERRFASRSSMGIEPHESEMRWVPTLKKQRSPPRHAVPPPCPPSPTYSQSMCAGEFGAPSSVQTWHRAHRYATCSRDL